MTSSVSEGAHRSADPEAGSLYFLCLPPGLGRVLREENAATVGDDGDVDGELRYMMGVIRAA